MTLFDEPQLDRAAEGQRRSEDGQARAEDHAHREWTDRALEIGRDLARRREGFRGEDILDRLDAEGFETHENRALGPTIRKLVAEFELYVVGVERSERPTQHRGKVRRWRAAEFRPAPCPTCGQDRP